MSKEPTPTKPQGSEPPRYSEGKGGVTTGQDQRAGPTTQAQAQNPKAGQPNPTQPPGQSQKSQIAQFFRSQGKQPDDVILEMGGMKLLLKDLD